MSLLNSIWDARVEDKEKLEEDFISFLRELGYPEGSLFRGPSFQFKLRGKWRETFEQNFGHHVVETNKQSLSCYADLGVLELDTSQYAALIEFRMNLNEQSESLLATVFEAVLDHVQTRPSVFLVTPGSENGFNIYQLQESGHWHPVPAKNFPPHATLAANFAASRTLNQESTQARNLDRFALTCRLLAGFVGAITLATIIGLRPLSSGQISMLILAALLLIAPEALGFGVAFNRSKPRAAEEQVSSLYSGVARRTRTGRT